MITIFVVTFNRLDTLKRTLESYKRLKTDHQVVIVDNGTDNPRCLSLLDELKNEYQIHRGPKIFNTDELTSNISAALSTYYYNGKQIPYFAVSDADVCFDVSSPNTLDVYVEAAEGLNRAVGPHLVVEDLHPNYPLRSQVIRMESRLLYRSRLTRLRDDVRYSHNPIDTTFVLFKRAPEFRRLQMDTIRVARPYAARHLDWYIDLLNPSEENLIYINKESLIGSYGGSWIKGFFNIFTKSKEEAFDYLVSSKKNTSDHCINSYMLSWMYQFGHGCGIDIEKSKEIFVNASSGHIVDTTADAIRMVYNNDFSAMD